MKIQITVVISRKEITYVLAMIPLLVSLVMNMV